MNYEVIAVDSTGRERDAWIVDAGSAVEARSKGEREVAHSNLPVDDYTFKVHRCTVAGSRRRRR